jgi:hypothetical protein
VQTLCSTKVLVAWLRKPGDHHSLDLRFVGCQYIRLPAALPPGVELLVPPTTRDLLGDIPRLVREIKEIE